MGATRQTFDADFQEFWQRFPRKVGKLAAKKEYDKVRRGGITQEELLDGVAQYIASKPAYADYCHPRTFLSQGRWMDEAPVDQWPSTGCQHEPECPDTWSHGQLVKAEASGDAELVAGVRRVNAKKAAAS